VTAVSLTVGAKPTVLRVAPAAGAAAAAAVVVVVVVAGVPSGVMVVKSTPASKVPSITQASSSYNPRL
jgi:hypothetical protein